MKDNKREPLLEQWAKQYIDEDGRRLLAEAEKLEESNPAPLPDLDGKVRDYRSTRRRGRYVAAFGAVAAGLLLIFLLPRLQPLSPELGTPLSDYPYAAEPEAPKVLEPSADAETQALDKPAQQAAESDMAADAVMEPSAALEEASRDALEMEEDAIPSDAEAPMSFADGGSLSMEEESTAAPAAPAASKSAPEAASPQSVAIIPLSFALPDGYAVDDVRQDRGETIYLLSNDDLDDVVLSLADADDSPLPTDSLVEIRNEAGDTAYGLAGADAQFLTFVRDGLRYRLTCQHDMQTLLSLWQHILSA